MGQGHSPTPDPQPGGPGGHSTLNIFGMGGPTKLPHHDKLVTPFGARKSIMYTQYTWF